MEGIDTPVGDQEGDIELTDPDVEMGTAEPGAEEGQRPEGAQDVPMPGDGMHEVQVPQAEQGGQRPRRRALVRRPSQRESVHWQLTAQPRKGCPASCRACAETFEQEEPRIALKSDARAGAARYYHLCCVPGGLHAMDVVDGALDAPTAVRDLLESIREDDRDREEDEVRLPVASIPRTVLDDTMQVDYDWWGHRAWDDAKQLHGGTLIDVPKATRAAYADFKLECIEEVEKAETSAQRKRG